jgi:hypothetical protein
MINQIMCSSAFNIHSYHLHTVHGPADAYTCTVCTTDYVATKCPERSYMISFTLIMLKTPWLLAVKAESTVVKSGQ